MDRPLFKDVLPVVSKHMEKSPITEEVQIKTTMSQSLTLIRTVTVNKTKKKITHFGKDMGETGSTVCCGL